jgi:hypothetical protein
VRWLIGAIVLGVLLNCMRIPMLQIVPSQQPSSGMSIMLQLQGTE